jgi:hypothetical protein
MEKLEEISRCYKWIEPTLYIQKSKDDQVAYVLYNSISNFKRDNDRFKLVTIEIPRWKSDYTGYITDYRIEYVKYLKNLYPESYSSDSGFSSIIDAIKSRHEDLIMLYKNFSLIGAASYSVIEKKNNIDITHIGVLERRKGYGTIIIKEIFRTAKILKYSMSVTSNGYADDFYHAFGMIRSVDKPLGIYTMKPYLYYDKFDNSHTRSEYDNV